MWFKCIGNGAIRLSGCEFISTAAMLLYLSYPYLAHLTYSGLTEMQVQDDMSEVQNVGPTSGIGYFT